MAIHILGKPPIASLSEIALAIWQQSGQSREDHRLSTSQDCSLYYDSVEATIIDFAGVIFLSHAWDGDFFTYPCIFQCVPDCLKFP